jgi:hypothetical protein
MRFVFTLLIQLFGAYPSANPPRRVVLQKIFWLQEVVAKNKLPPQYRVWLEIFCNTTSGIITRHLEAVQKAVWQRVSLANDSL